MDQILGLLLTSFRYTDHTFMVMTLQKLVHLHDNDGSDTESETDSIGGTRKHKHGRISKAFHKMFSKSSPNYEYDDKQRRASTATGINGSNGFVTGHTDGVDTATMQNLKTLQSYHGGVNQERIKYMEQHSPLTKRGLAISAEQVSIFLTSGKMKIPSTFLHSLILQTILSFHSLKLRLMTLKNPSSID